MTAHAKKYFRATLETLENREMMDAGIGGAVMHPMMPDSAQGAQVRLLTQETSALQNPNNPLPQLLTQANQAFVAQSQQVNANVQAVDHIFSAWSHHVDQVVQNISGLQAVANNDLDQSNADKYGRKVADAFIEKFAQGGRDNAWGIREARFISAKPL